MSFVTDPQDLTRLRESCRRLARVLDVLETEVRPGVTTKALDDRAQELIRAGGDTPAFLGYKPHFAKRPYPAALCVSVNDEVVHGIPSEYRLIEEGDVVTLDLGLIHEGMYSDSARTVAVGAVSPRVMELLAVTKEALAAGIKAARPGNAVGDISHAIQSTVEPHGFGIPEWLGGHGVGYKPHDDPDVPNVGKAGKGPKLVPGMVLAIEPIVNLGSEDAELLDDDYTVVTSDGEVSAQFEHTILITERGPEILTRANA